MLYFALYSLFGWMPVELQIFCGGALALFLIFAVLSIIALITDVIPFL